MLYSCIFYLYENHKQIYISEIDVTLKKNSNDYSLFFKSAINSIKNLTETTGNLLLPSISESKDVLNPEVSTKITSTFNRIINKSSTLHSIYFVDNKTGVEINYKGNVTIEDRKIDLRTRIWYTQAIATNSSIISKVYDDVATGKPVITVSYAIKKDDNLIGVIATDLFLDDFYNTYNVITNNGYTNTNITDQYGNVILNHEKNLLGFSMSNPQAEYLATYNVNEQKIINSYKDLWTKHLSGNEFGQIDYINILGVNVHGYFTKIPDLNWRIISLIDYDIMNKNFNNYLFKLLLTGFILSIILISYVYFILSTSNYNDILTDSYNKNKLIDILNKKSKSNKEKFILYIDINEFSSINTTYGNAVGDKILKEFTLILRHHLSDYGTLVHYKSADFMFLFETQDWNYALSIAKEHHELLSKTIIKIEDFTISINTFMGLIKFNKNQLRDVENSLHLSKDTLNDLKNSDNKAFLSFDNFDDMLKINEEKTKKKTTLLKAIDEDRIIPFFQPIYNIRKDNVSKYEVLMRINSGDEYLSPFPFIQIAEENNLIETVDLIVLEKALAYKNIADPDDTIEFSFNISGKMLNNDDYLIKVIDIMKIHNIKAKNIVLEITETQSIKNLDNLASIMHTYKKLGIKFSIDDFGTAFSSIQYLKQIPANYIKIDGSFIRDINDKKENFYLVQSILSMSKAFKMETIAEFVESEQILNTISEIGIDYAQGYYVGKPKKSIIQVSI
ncbi:EAL domain-containing protein [Clostridium sp.]|uniref:EAL domain-containing protein n=1 Tax=Clostridium sp. TaxID=1506 RepID=UPI0025BB657E|nr:EAL domain-containing protein [Clostridium sp.]